ncbi:MAG: hypothetical protein HC828_03960 [Blastochloris sp.]|nr:hypothetical protein [Blastochloris sp.]
MHDRTTTPWVAHIRDYLTVVGTAGGQISPSIYDTAQLLRWTPPPDPHPARRWLLDQQQADGGWGDPVMPRARTVPTLAAVLALHEAGKPYLRDRIEQGCRWLFAQAPLWGDPLPQDIPVGVELVLPRLLTEARQHGLPLPYRAYTAVEALGTRRQVLLAAQRLQAGTAPLHSWEGWGTDPDPALLDASGGMGHSPAATAVWLAQARQQGVAPAAGAHAAHYLQQAGQATGSGVAGVVPTVWPIPRFEQIFALYFLMMSGLHEHPDIAPLVQQQADDLQQALGPEGIGMSDAFMVDGDLTTTASIVGATLGSALATPTLTRFRTNQHVFTYPGELQPSLTTTAHAAQALAASDAGPPLQDYLLAQQDPMGIWTGDKWHASWLYTTSQVMLALRSYAPAQPALQRAATAIRQAQHPTGGWGMAAPTTEETAYALLALGITGHPTDPVLAQGATWLTNHWSPERVAPPRWIGKELYVPTRLVPIIELAVLVQVTAGRTHTRTVGVPA